jgi:hypothetical protein
VKLGDVIVANQIADYTLGKREGRKKREIRWRAYEPDQNLLDQAISAFKVVTHTPDVC